MSILSKAAKPTALTLSSGQIALLSSPRIMKNINGWSESMSLPRD